MVDESRLQPPQPAKGLQPAPLVEAYGKDSLVKSKPDMAGTTLRSDQVDALIDGVLPGQPDDDARAALEAIAGITSAPLASVDAVEASTVSPSAPAKLTEAAKTEAGAIAQAASEVALLDGFQPLLDKLPKTSAELSDATKNKAVKDSTRPRVIDDDGKTMTLKQYEEELKTHAHMQEVHQKAHKIITALLNKYNLNDIKPNDFGQKATLARLLDNVVDRVSNFRYWEIKSEDPLYTLIDTIAGNYAQTSRVDLQMAIEAIAESLLNSDIDPEQLEKIQIKRRTLLEGERKPVQEEKPESEVEKPVVVLSPLGAPPAPEAQQPGAPVIKPPVTGAPPSEPLTSPAKPATEPVIPAPPELEAVVAAAPRVEVPVIAAPPSADEVEAARRVAEAAADLEAAPAVPATMNAQRVNAAIGPAPLPNAPPVETQKKLFWVASADKIMRDKQSRLSEEFHQQWQQKRQKNLFSNLASGFWQRSIAAPWFKERGIRWNRIVLNKCNLNILPQEVIEKALLEGEKRVAQRSAFRRNILDRLRSPFCAILAWHTPEQIEAQKWMQEQVQLARGEKTVYLNKGREFKKITKADLDEIPQALKDYAANKKGVFHSKDQKKVDRETLKWLNDQLKLAQKGKTYDSEFKTYLDTKKQKPDGKIISLLTTAFDAKEGFAGEMSVGVRTPKRDDQGVIQHDPNGEIIYEDVKDIKHTLRGDAERKEVTDPGLKKELIKDFFNVAFAIKAQVAQDVASGLYTADSEQAKIKANLLLDRYFTRKGLDDGTNNYSFIKRIRKTDFDGWFGSPSTTVGSTMRRVMDLINYQGDAYVMDGTVDANDAASWIKACTEAGTNGKTKIDMSIFLAKGEMMVAGDRRGVLIKLNRKVAKAMENTVFAKIQRKMEGKVAESEKSIGYYVSKAVLSVTANEAIAWGIASWGGYALSFGECLIPKNVGQIKMLAGVAGVSTVAAGVLVGSTIGLPVLIPAAAGAIAAGVIAGIREASRTHQQVLQHEMNSSLSIADKQIKVRANPFKFLITQQLTEKELEQASAVQKGAGEILGGLTGCGLFAKPGELTSALPTNVTAENVRQAVRALVDAKARIDLSSDKNRRLIKYGGQMSETRQQELIDGARHEVRERLLDLMVVNPTMFNLLAYDIDRSTNPPTNIPPANAKQLIDLINNMVKVCKTELVGTRKQLDPKLAAVLDPDQRAYVAEQDTLNARNKARRSLMARRGASKGLGTAVTSFVLGNALIEARHAYLHLTGSLEENPVSLIGKLLGEDRAAPVHGMETRVDVFVPKIDNETPIEIPMHLPKHFSIITDPGSGHRIMVSGLNNFRMDMDNPQLDWQLNANGALPQKTLDILKRVGIVIVGADGTENGGLPVPDLEIHSNLTYKAHFGNTEITLPRGVDLDVVTDENNHQIATRLVLEGHAVDQQIHFDLGDKTDLEKLTKFLEEHNLQAPKGVEVTEITPKPVLDDVKHVIRIDGQEFDNTPQTDKLKVDGLAKMLKDEHHTLAWVAEKVEKGVRTVEKEIIQKAEEVLGHFNHPVVNTEYYGYNEDGSQMDELGLRTYADEAGKKVAFDFKDMTATWQNGVDPQHLQVDQLIAKRDPNIGILFKSGKGDLFFPAPDGRLELSTEQGPGQFLLSKEALKAALPGAEKTSDGLLNVATELRDKLDVIRVGLVHAGRMVGDKFQSFATIRGIDSILPSISLKKPEDIPWEIHRWLIGKVEGIKYNTYQLVTQTDYKDTYHLAFVGTDPNYAVASVPWAYRRDQQPVSTTYGYATMNSSPLPPYIYERQPAVAQATQNPPPPANPTTSSTSQVAQAQAAAAAAAVAAQAAQQQLDALRATPVASQTPEQIAEIAAAEAQVAQLEAQRVAAEAAAAITPSVVEPEPQPAQPPNPARPAAPAADPRARLVELKQKAARGPLTDPAEKMELAALEAAMAVPPRVETLQQKAESMAREIRAQGFGCIEASVRVDTRDGDPLDRKYSFEERQGSKYKGMHNYYGFYQNREITDPVEFEQMNENLLKGNVIAGLIQCPINSERLVLQKYEDAIKTIRNRTKFQGKLEADFKGWVCLNYQFDNDYGGGGRGDTLMLHAVIPDNIAQQIFDQVNSNPEFAMTLFKALYPQMVDQASGDLNIVKRPTTEIQIVDRRADKNAFNPIIKKFTQSRGNVPLAQAAAEAVAPAVSRVNITSSKTQQSMVEIDYTKQSAAAPRSYRTTSLLQRKSISLLSGTKLDINSPAVIGITSEFKSWLDNNHIKSKDTFIHNCFGKKVTVERTDPKKPVIMVGSVKIDLNLVQAAVRGQLKDINRWASIEQLPGTTETVRIINIPVQTLDGKIVILRVDNEMYGQLKNLTITDSELMSKKEARLACSGGRIGKEGETDYAKATVGLAGRNYEVTMASNIGGVRSIDEDYSLLTEGTASGRPWRFIAVFDGMGGHAAGDEASKLSALVIRDLLKNELRKPQLSYSDKRGAIHTINTSQLDQESEVQKLFGYIDYQISIHPALQRIRQVNGGTTMAGIFEFGGKLYSVNCGDSRVYKSNGTALEQLTVDHSMVQSKISAGMISIDDAKAELGGSVIYRQLLDGKGIDVKPINLQPNESIVIMCDGVPEAYDDEYTNNPTTMLAALNTALTDQYPAKAFINQAMSAPGATNGQTQDNVSVIIIKPSKP